MPYRDGTGPYGEGPLTGRGLGPCGRGRRFFRGRFWSPSPIVQRTITKEEEKRMLEEERRAAEEEIKAIEKRLKELESD